MSRIAKKPIFIPKDVKIEINYPLIKIKGKNGNLEYKINNIVNIKYIDEKLIFDINYLNNNSWSLAGTTRSVINNMIIGVNNFFEKKLILVGVGYRSFIKENFLILNLGFSHEIKMLIPNDIYINCDNQNEIIIKGINKQKVTQIAANICLYRRLDPYKGKGIRDSKSIIRLKEKKKK